MLNVILMLIEQVEVKNQKSGEMSMNIPNYMAFLYFPKNFTRDLSTYIVNRKNSANLAYVKMTRESKYYFNLQDLYFHF